MKYSEKLKDPRWQKKRLEILQRDGWRCQKCGDTEETLHVHHRIYRYNKDPWDYPNEIFITLCEACHESERESRPEYEKMLLNSIREKFLSDDIFSIFKGFYKLKLIDPPEVTATIIEWFLGNDDLQQEISDRYFKHIVSKKDGKSSS